MMKMKKTMTVLAAVALCGAALAENHDLVIEGPVLSADEGLLLGNGDLSCSAYQTADHLVFRLGKGDVWDRRMDFEGLPKPAHIQEFIDGELKEGWKSNPFDKKATEATKGTKDEKRMKEICGGGKNAVKRPFPCPKPTGELRIKLPMDMPGRPTIVQRLVVEEGLYEIAYVWKNGVKVTVKAVIPYDENVLAVSWKVTGWDDQTYVGYDYGNPAVWVTLTRWADPAYPGWGYKYLTDFNIAANVASADSNADIVPNPAPKAFLENGAGCIEQRFFPDGLFKDGFKYRLTLTTDPETGAPRVIDTSVADKDAWIGLSPKKKGIAGELAVAVTTSRDVSFAAPARKPFAQYREETAASMRAFWSARSLSVPFDREIERLWYATCYARRCVLRGGTVPPGLFLPSTVDDYSYWHGDYHSNYNLAANYWGCMNAGQLKEMESYFDAVDFFVPIGRKIAKDYYGCRGVFIQLSGFPTVGPEDHQGNLPLGRMAYMTGWFMEYYWDYYRMTMDREWLAKRGYPFIRDCALFYADFLKKAPNPNLPPELNDGKYHLFPSIDGESGFSGNPMDVCDKPQSLTHARKCLYFARLAAEELGVDADLVALWKERFENLVHTPLKFDGNNQDELRYHCWLSGRGTVGGCEYKAEAPWDGKPARKLEGLDNWYFGMGAMWRCCKLRDSSYVFDRDYPRWRKLVDKWARPNGLIRAMCLAHYGRVAWTETLSCMAPLEEMLLQSWDGSLRLFPRWSKTEDVSFEGFRAEGAFVVSGEQKGGVRTVRVKSLKGVPCAVTGAWSVTAEDGSAVTVGKDRFGRMQFETRPGATYVLTRK